MNTFLKWLCNFLPKTHYQKDKEKIDNLIKTGNVPKFDKNTQVEFMLGINTRAVFSKLEIKHLDYGQLHLIFDITRDEFLNILNSRKFDIALALKNEQDGLWITDRENFEGQIGKKNMVFGFNLEEDEEGNISINNLQPGSAAFKSGRLNKGDKIIAIQWEGAKPIDVSKASAEEIADILEQNNHAKATLTIVKQDGTKRQVELAKEKET